MHGQTPAIRGFAVGRARIYGRLGDRLFRAFLLLLALGVVGAAGLTAYELYVGGSPSLERHGLLGFLVGTTWDPVIKVEFGALPFILGTLVTSAAALALSFLPAIAVALFVAEYAPRWLSTPVAYLVDLLAAIPSVVYGIWGIFVLVPWVRQIELGVYMWAGENAGWLLPILGPPTGIGLLSAILILAVMIVPFSASVARDAIQLVPVAQREAAYALGATRWEALRMAVLPYARGGIMAGVILSLARALGETMAVTMVIGNAHDIPKTLFGPAATMASVIANEFTEAVVDLHLASLLGVGFYLFVLSLIVNLVAAWVIRTMGPKEGRA